MGLGRLRALFSCAATNSDSGRAAFVACLALGVWTRLATRVLGGCRGGAGTGRARSQAPE